MLLIVWRGWGIVMLAPAIVCPIAMELGVNAAMQDASYYEAHGWPKLLALWIAAAVSWPIGRWMNRPRPQSIDGRAPGQHLTFREKFGDGPEWMSALLELSSSQSSQLNDLLEEEHTLDSDESAQDGQHEQLKRRREWQRQDIRRRAVELLTPEQRAHWQELLDAPAYWGMEVPGDHSLFFIPVQYWWIVFVALGVAAAFL
jgi:hypothetical protein